MPDILVRNHRTSAQARWVNFVIPRGHALAGSAYLDCGNGRIAARQAPNFDSTVDADGGDWIYSVRDNWAGAGSLRDGSVTRVPVAALGSDPQWSLAIADYYASGTCGTQSYNAARFPIIKIASANSWTTFQSQIDLRGARPTVIFSGNRYRCLELERHQDGFHVRFWLHIWHEQNVAEWTMSVCWSDETVTDTWFLGSKGIVVDFGNTVVKSKWGHLEQWETLGGTRWEETTTGTSFRLPFTFHNGDSQWGWGRTPWPCPP